MIDAPTTRTVELRTSLGTLVGVIRLPTKPAIVLVEFATRHYVECEPGVFRERTSWFTSQRDFVEHGWKGVQP